MEVQTPGWHELKGTSSPEAVTMLQVTEQNPSTFMGILILIIPPSILTTILDTNTMDPTQLIPILVLKIWNFTD